MERIPKIFAKVIDLVNDSSTIQHDLNTKDFMIQIYKQDTVMWDYRVSVVNENNLMINGVSGECKIVIIG